MGAPNRATASLVLEHELEVELCEPRVLAGDLLRARALMRPQCVDQDPVLMLSHDQDLARAPERRMRAEQRSRRGEREGGVCRDRAGERRALGQR